MHDQLVGVAVVPPVAHQLADVVQQRRGLEEIAAGRRQLVGLLQLVEHPDGQHGDVVAVPLVRPALAREVAHPGHRNNFV